VQELHLNEKEQAQFMRKLMATGMERQEKPDVALTAIVSLLNTCWFKPEVREAIVQLQECARDLELDLPRCQESIAALIAQAENRGLLERNDKACDRIPDV